MKKVFFSLEIFFVSFSFALVSSFLWCNVSYAAPGGVGTDLQFWLKADAGTNVDGSSNFINGAGAWLDQSGNGRNINLVANDPQLLPAGLNFNPAVHWDGNDWMRIDGVPQSNFFNSFTEGEVFAVVQENTPLTAGHGPFYYFGGLTTSWYTWTNTFIYDAFGTTTRKAWDPDNVAGGASEGGGTVTGPDVDVSQFNIYNVYSATNDWVASFNGLTAYTDTVTAVSFSGSNVHIGARPGLVANGVSSEHILYDRKLTDTERLQVNSYLATKYGLTLGTTTDPVDYLASDGTTTFWTGDATYQNNIAGIGRDDTGELDQRQSRSSELDDRDGMVTIALGALDVDNASNANSFGVDLSFLMWGDNAADPHFGTAITSPGNIADVRLDRIWTVQETGTVGTTQLAIPTSVGFGDTVYLVISADETFDATDTFLQMDPLTINGVDYVAADYDFTDGEFFTFATTLLAPGGVTGSQVWLRADDGLIVDGSDNATNWLDRSDHSRDADIITGDPQRIDGAVNFNPVVQFDGNDRFQFSSSPFVTNFAAGEAFGILKDNVYTSCNCGHLFDFGGSSRSFHYTWGNAAIYEGFGTNNRLGWNPLTGGIVDGKSGIASIAALADPRNFHLYNVHSATNDWGVFFDGNEVGSTTINTTNFSLSAHNEQIGGATANIFNGDGAEVLLFDRVLSPAERMRVNSYLATKYGVSLGTTASPSDYVASDGVTIYWTGDAVYQNNVTGIGRDDTSGLDQRQSQNVNPQDGGDLVTMGLGTIAGDNGSNPNAFGADLDFMMWGDNGLSSDFGVVFTPPGGVNANFHMARTWNIQETGTVGTVKITVPNSLGGGDPVYLIVSNDDIFDSGDQYFELTSFSVGANSYLAEDVDFVDGQFFTFASANTAPGGVGSGLHIWYKADASTGAATTGDPVNTWLDSSDNGFDAIQTGDPSLQENQINFNPAVYYDGTADGHNSPAGSQVSGEYGFFGVAQMEGPLNRRVFSTLHTNALIGFWNNREDVVYNLGNPANHTTGPVATTDPKLYTFTRDLSSTTVFRESARQILTDASSANPLLRFGIANGGAYSGERSRVYVPEMIIYDAALSAAELNRVESYLALKYGKTLDQTVGTDYTASDGVTEMWDKDAAGASTYNNDIAGIGQDLAAGLLQLRSRSVNRDGIVAIGTPGDLMNLEFITWGNNDGPVDSFVIAGAPMGYQRLAREWSVQETGDVGTVTVEVDVQDPDLNVVNFGPSLFLLYDENNDGDLTNDTPVQMFDDGTNGDATGGDNIWTVQGINFDDGEEFTFATETIKVEFTDAASSDAEMSGGNLPTLTVAGGVLVANQSVEVALNGGSSATNGTDFNFTPPTTVTIPAGDYSSPLTIAIPGLTTSDDFFDESDETIILDLQNPSAGIVIDDADGGATTESQHTYTILDDDTVGAIITVPDDLTSEDGDTGEFCIELTAEPTADVTIDLTSSNTDEGTVQASVTILVADWNDPSANCVTVTGEDDVVPLGDGTVVYSIITGNVSSGDLAYNVLDGSTIDDPVFQNQNNDPPGINVIVVDATSGEDGSTATVQFELLSQPAGVDDVTIPLSLTDLTEGDLGGVTEIVILNADWDDPAANEVIITGVDDTDIDGDIAYQLITGDPASGDPAYDALLASDVADPSFTSEDNDGLVVEFADPSASDLEASGGNLPTLTVSGAVSAVPYTVQVADAGTGSATSGVDYGFVSPTTVTIPAGDYTTPQIIVIPGLTINDDVLFEADETIDLQLQNPTGELSLGDADGDTNTNTTHTYTIEDDESETVSIVANDPDAAENPADNGEFTLTMSAVNNTGAPLTVNYTVSGTADGGDDYTVLSGTVDIPDGVDAATITVDTAAFDDALFESGETVIVTLDSTSNLAVTVDPVSDNATVLISDDEYTAGATVSISSSGSPAENPLASGTFTVTLSMVNNTHSPVTVDYSVGGTATDGADYITLSGSVDIPDGSDTAVVTLTPINDPDVESDETVVLTLVSTSALTVTSGAPDSASLTIISDDTTSTSSGGGGGGGGSGISSGSLSSAGGESAGGEENPAAEESGEPFFTDIENHWAFDYIEEIHEKCEGNGYLDEAGQILHLFRPDNEITRAELLIMIMKCSGYDPAVVTEKPFPDVEIGHWSASWVEQAKLFGIIHGYGDGTFRPDHPASRAEALKMILLAQYPPEVIDLEAQNSLCQDLDPEAWYLQYFYFGVERGIINGYKDGNGSITGECAPDNHITRAETAKIIIEGLMDDFV